MNREYHKGFSRELNREMEMLVFGHGGHPIIVFPTSMAPFFEWEDRQMIEPMGHMVADGKVQAFLVASVDAESWYNKRVHPRERVQRYLQYDRFLVHELLPYIRSRNHTPSLAVTGCSFGGYHAVNFALKHPDCVTHCVSLGGAFDIHQFLNGYYDESCYFNCPPDFLPNLHDDWFLSRYRQMKIVLATGEWDHCLDQNVKLSQQLHHKAVPHWLDVWGDQTGHDWPWWQRMVGKYFG
jgi:esterase/lipase superfamily enzyme